MKCPTCGFENAKSYGTCTRCGRFLGAYSIQTPKAQDTGAKTPSYSFTGDISSAGRSKDEISHEEIASKMKLSYLHGTRDVNQRTLEVILKLLETSRSSMTS
jgi:predicted ATP-dependent serine protease